MEYLSVNEARNSPGLRLVLTAHVPGPWGQAAKAVLGFRSVDYLPVAQMAGEANDELVEWTGMRNAPIAVLDDEPPCSGWLEILFLAERLGRGPSLLPDHAEDRQICLGIAAEICGFWGLGWCRRISMWTLSGPAKTSGSQRLRDQYGFAPDTAASAPERLFQILSGLDQRLAAQHSLGNRYLVGDRPTAADLYWASFSIMFDVPDHLADHIPAYQRAMYDTYEPRVAGVLSDRLIAHRDHIFQDVIGLPLEF
ncbi:hypothetical protein NUH86_18255 [Sphingobium sp. JS3065]|uniref:hypothetical protein n=1 Tax=Sphingobium sp. JS3065 TaxID=2970925 RepID=UPI002263E57A|nr:hypothetical protein [Sphingobium sp. JS3065]UZW57525.1 hypothetical protein NUH86_18255 [Sphingobium sp. JS3065]